MNGFFTKCRHYVLSVNTGTQKKPTNKTITFKQTIVTNEKECSTNKLQNMCRKTTPARNVSIEPTVPKTRPVVKESNPKNSTKIHDFSVQRSSKPLKTSKYKSSNGKKFRGSYSSNVTKKGTKSDFNDEKLYKIPKVKTVSLKSPDIIDKNNKFEKSSKRVNVLTTVTYTPESSKELHLVNTVACTSKLSKLTTSTLVTTSKSLDKLSMNGKLPTNTKLPTESVQNIITEDPEMGTTDNVTINKLSIMNQTRTDDKKLNLLRNKSENQLITTDNEPIARYLIFDPKLSALDNVVEKGNVINDYENSVLNGKSYITSNVVLSHTPTNQINPNINHTNRGEFRFILDKKLNSSKSKSSLSSNELITDHLVLDDIFDTTINASSDDTKNDKMEKKESKNCIAVQDSQPINSVPLTASGVKIVVLHPKVLKTNNDSVEKVADISTVEVIKSNTTNPSGSNLKYLQSQEVPKKINQSLWACDLNSSITAGSTETSYEGLSQTTVPMKLGNSPRRFSSTSSKSHIQFTRAVSLDFVKTRSIGTNDTAVISRMWDDVSLIDFSNREILDDNELLSPYFDEYETENCDKQLTTSSNVNEDLLKYPDNIYDEEEISLLNKIGKPNRHTRLQFVNTDMDEEIIDNCDNLLKDESPVFILSLKYCDYRVLYSRTRQERRFSGNIVVKSQEFSHSKRQKYFGNYGSIDGIHSAGSKLKQKSISNRRGSSVVSRESFKALSHMLNLKSLMTRKSIQIRPEALAVFMEHVYDSDSNSESNDETRTPNNPDEPNESSVDVALMSKYTKKTNDQNENKSE